jgi:hypothetical protein
VLSDFAAIALAILHLAEGDRIQIGPGVPVRASILPDTQFGDDAQQQLVAPEHDFVEIIIEFSSAIRSTLSSQGQSALPPWSRLCRSQALRRSRAALSSQREHPGR